MKNFPLKLERQFVCFICLLFTLHLLFKFFEWEGQFAWLIFIPLIFSLVNLLSFILKGFQKSIWETKYLLIGFLYLIVALKIEFTFYNIWICILFVAISIYVLIYQTFKITNLKPRLTLLIILNFILIIIPDILIFKYIHSTDKQLWSNKLEWANFQGSEPEDIGEMDAKIRTTIYWKDNRVYNSPRFISLSVMKELHSWVRPENSSYEGNLLNHEQLHFDITEWTRREFQDSIYSLKTINLELVNDIYDYFYKLNNKRQYEYDSISKHGIDFIGQIQWEKKVKLKLNEE